MDSAVRMFTDLRQKAARHWAICIIVLAFLAAGIVLATTWYQYQINPDATSYLTIATKYAHGDFRHAINGYWGPLISWLLVPAVWLHANLIIAAKAILTLCGAAILVTLYWFLIKQKVGRMVAAFACLFTAALLIKEVSFGPITPDLLIAFGILLFAVRLDAFISKPTMLNGTIVGAIGAFMYFAKGFGFYLFLAIVGLVGLWQWWSSRQFWDTVRRFLPVALTFLVLVLPFIAVITLKYHSPTISNAGAFDHNLYGPTTQGEAYPMFTNGPLAPPNDTAASIWEDPSLLTPMMPNWKPYASAKNAEYFIGSVIGANWSNTLVAIHSFGSLVALGVLVMILGVLRKGANRQQYAIFLLIAAVMACGYSLVLTETRYLLGGMLLAVGAAALWTATLRKAGVFNRLQIIIGGLIICCVTILASYQAVVVNQYSGRGIHDLAVGLQPVLPKGAKIVSDSFDSVYLCYYLQLQCYSALNPPAEGGQDYYAVLKQLGIGYYVEYHTDRDSIPAVQDFVAQYFTPLLGGDGTATVYALR